MMASAKAPSSAIGIQTHGSSRRRLFTANLWVPRIRFRHDAAISYSGKNLPNKMALRDDVYSPLLLTSRFQALNLVSPGTDSANLIAISKARSPGELRRPARFGSSGESYFQGASYFQRTVKANRETLFPPPSGPIVRRNSGLLPVPRLEACGAPDLDLGELGDARLTLDEAERLMFESREVGAVQHCPEPVAPAHGADVDHARPSARGVPTLAPPWRSSFERSGRDGCLLSPGSRE